MSEERFAFGKNWREYIDKHFDQEAADVSKRHMLEFLGRERLDGLTFLDIGCGSGLHSLAAFQSGAARVFGFDYDNDSVEATRILHKYAGEPENWSMTQGSVLDDAFIETLDKADIVYSWGVLHHTGDQWKAIRNAASRVKDGGEFYIALYTSDVFIDPTPEFWLDVKQRYVAASWWGKRKLELWYVMRFERPWNPKYLVALIKKIAAYRTKRGMSYYTDIKDWLGGWPMEFSAIAEVKEFVGEKLGFELKKIKDGEANTEYLFVKRASAGAAGGGEQAAEPAA